MNKIYYYCPQNLINSYFETQKKLIKSMGYDLIYINYSNYRKELIDKKPINSIIILNFVENGHGSGKRLLAFYLYWLIILKNSKKNNNKIIFVYHNLSIHDAKPIKRILSDLAILYLKKNSDAIQLLSYNSSSYIKKSYRNKCFVIPHSMYANDYETTTNNNKDNLNLLFFGMIKKYKNIEMIIKIARNNKDKNITFTIRGDANTKYCNKLIRMSKNLKNVVIIPNFVPDNEISTIMSKCDAIILPYNKKSCLNSGAAILAGSYRKTFICPSIATIKDMPNNLIYSYDYSNKKNHLINLQNIIIKMYNDKNNNPNILIEKGQQLQNYLIENHSEQIIIERYRKMFDYLNNKKD